MSAPQPAIKSSGHPAEFLKDSDLRCIGPKRMWGGLAALAVLALVFLPVAQAWYRVAMGDDLHSHVLLIPLVSLYLLVTKRDELAWNSRPSPLAGCAVLLAAAMIFGWVLVVNPAWSSVDLTALKVFSFVGFLWGLVLVFLGEKWLRSAIFAMAFLLFMIPLPDQAVLGLERFLMVASAWLSEVLFSMGGIPVFKSGQILELPGTVLEVAQECSGIRSSWVLLITSVLAANILLPTVPRQMVLIAAVLPLAIFRNAVRIFVIGWLCVNHGNEMIDSWIHRKGGPVFFAASLLPLLLLAWWLRKCNTKDLPRDPATDGT